MAIQGGEYAQAKRHSALKAAIMQIETRNLPDHFPLGTRGSIWGWLAKRGSFVSADDRRDASAAASRQLSRRIQPRPPDPNIMPWGMFVPSKSHLVSLLLEELPCLSIDFAPYYLPPNLIRHPTPPPFNR